MNKKRIFGLSFITLAVVIIILNAKITGAFVGTVFSNSLSFAALIFFVVGILLFFEKQKNYAQEVLESRRYVDKTGELKRIAREMGYELVEGYREGTRVLKGDKVLTVIPKGKRVNGKGTIISILEAMATGESNFRRRAG